MPRAPRRSSSPARTPRTSSFDVTTCAGRRHDVPVPPGRGAAAPAPHLAVAVHDAGGAVDRQPFAELGHQPNAQLSLSATDGRRGAHVHHRAGHDPGRADDRRRHRAQRRRANIAFLAPASNGGLPITSYTATPRLAAHRHRRRVARSAITGLTNGSTYTIKVHRDQQRRQQRLLGREQRGHAQRQRCRATAITDHAVAPADLPRDGRQRRTLPSASGPALHRIRRRRAVSLRLDEALGTRGIKHRRRRRPRASSSRSTGATWTNYAIAPLHRHRQLWRIGVRST
jgi:hypothetical protein